MLWWLFGLDALLIGAEPNYTEHCFTSLPHVVVRGVLRLEVSLLVSLKLRGASCPVFLKPSQSTRAVAFIVFASQNTESSKDCEV